MAASVYFFQKFALASAGIACLSIAYLALHVSHSLPNLNTTAAKLNATLDTVNDPNPRRGTLRLLNKDLVDLGDLTKEAHVAINATTIVAAQESKSLDSWNASIGKTLTDVDTTVQTINKSTLRLTDSSISTLDQASKTIAYARPTLSAAAGTLQASTTTLERFNTILADPQIPQIMAHTEGMTASGDRIAKDAADEADKLAHPTKKIGFWGAVDASLLYFHSHIAPPLF